MSEVQTYPGYTQKAYRWKYSQEVYDGSAFDYQEGDTNAEKYFPQKAQRESKEAYKERLSLIDPPLYYATGVDSLVGTMFVADSGNKDTWGGMGDPAEPDSLAYQFINDANGNGLNWTFIGKQAAIKLAIKHTVFALVEGIPENAEGNPIGGPTAHIIEPESVINKVYDQGRLVACRVKEDRVLSKSLDDIPKSQTCFVDYTLDGWNRWYYNEKGEKVPFSDASAGEYTYWRTTEKRDKILPIFEVSLPLDRPVGYTWAKKCIAIANMESALEFGYRNTSFAVFQPVASEDQWEKIKKDLDKGYNAFRSDPEASRDHTFLAPPSNHFDSYKGYLKEKIKNFFYNMFKDYGDAAKEQTATQARLESQSGIDAFLILLAGQTDEIENGILWRIEQCHFPNSPQNWGTARVERSNDFNPVDVDAVADNLASRYITGMNVVPAPVDIVAQALTNIYEASGFSVSDNVDEVDEVAKKLVNEREQERDMMSQAGG